VKQKLYIKREVSDVISFRTFRSLHFEENKFLFVLVFLFFVAMMNQFKIIYLLIAFISAVFIVGSIILKIFAFEKTAYILQPVVMVLTLAR
jgi:hypothetical protein